MVVVNWMWQGVAVAAAVRVALRLAPRVNAATRYAVWLAALAAVALLPGVPRQAWTPSREVAVLPEGASVPEPRGIPPPLALWGIGSGLLAGRLGLSYLGSRRLKRSARAAGAAEQARLDYWCTACGIARRVELRRSGRVATPVSIALGRPVILLPATSFHLRRRTR